MLFCRLPINSKNLKDYEKKPHMVVTATTQHSLGLRGMRLALERKTTTCQRTVNPHIIYKKDKHESD